MKSIDKNIEFLYNTNNSSAKLQLFILNNKLKEVSNCNI